MAKEVLMLSSMGQTCLETGPHLDWCVEICYSLNISISRELIRWQYAIDQDRAYFEIKVLQATKGFWMVGIARSHVHDKKTLGDEGESWVLKSEHISCRDGDVIGCAYDQVGSPSPLHSQAQPPSTHSDLKSQSCPCFVSCCQLACAEQTCASHNLLALAFQPPARLLAGRHADNSPLLPQRSVPRRQELGKGARGRAREQDER